MGVHMYVCLCRGITDQDIKDAVANGAESFREIRDLLDLGTCCGRCAPEARNLINEELAAIAAKISIAA
jgi:bacterioferritin-associated ferredoxin